MPRSGKEALQRTLKRDPHSQVYSPAHVRWVFLIPEMLMTDSTITLGLLSQSTPFISPYCGKTARQLTHLFAFASLSSQPSVSLLLQQSISARRLSILSSILSASEQSSEQPMMRNRLHLRTAIATETLNFGSARGISLPIRRTDLRSKQNRMRRVL